ncbi:MAG: hypothetical protein ACKOCT_12915 [Alphaproteobacteria bacterium]
MEIGSKQSFAALREHSLAAQRKRLATVPIEERLLEVIAWSALVLADERARGLPNRSARERPLPPGLGRLLR